MLFYIYIFRIEWVFQNVVVFQFSTSWARLVDSEITFILHLVFSIRGYPLDTAPYQGLISAGGV